MDLFLCVNKDKLGSPIYKGADPGESGFHLQNDKHDSSQQRSNDHLQI